MIRKVVKYIPVLLALNITFDVFAASTAPAPSYPTEAMANDATLKQIGAYAAWSRGYTGKGVRIGFVDTGADLTHPDLINVIAAKSPYYSTMVDVDRGHGTGMLSLALAAKNNQGIIGVAYEANGLIYAGGISGFLLNSDINNGIKWLADNKADIINLSLGARQTTSNFDLYYKNIGDGIYVRNKGVTDPYSSTSQLASLQYATSRGSIVVMSAGNDSNPTPTSPAVLAVRTDAAGNLLLGGRAIIVGAVDKNNVIANYSNRAGHICQNVTASGCADVVQVKDYFLVAPGGLVYEANANYTSASNMSKNPIAQELGSSVSSAIVSGGISLIRQAWPALKPEQIVQILLKSATDLGPKGVDSTYGNGLINLDAATRPIGALQLAKIAGVSNTQLVPSSVALSSSGMVGGVVNKLSFTGSQVMKSAQVVDSLGRNFSVDMTAGMSNSLLNYVPLTSYSGLSTTTIQPVDISIGNFSGVAYSSHNLLGTRVGHQLGDFYWGVEVGEANERSSILGTKGFGALGVGDSNTRWYGVHLSQNISENMNLYSNWMRGVTRANADPSSLITEISQVQTQTWTIGVTKNKLIDSQDSLSFQVTQLPRITQGYATVTGVTGYQYSNVTEEGASATANVTSEKVNLVNDYRQYAGTVSYARKLDSKTRLKINYLMQADNAGTVPRHSLGFQVLRAF